jgi:hypothetical protein
MGRSQEVVYTDPLEVMSEESIKVAFATDVIIVCNVRKEQVSSESPKNYPGLWCGTWFISVAWVVVVISDSDTSVLRKSGQAKMNLVL